MVLFGGSVVFVCWMSPLQDEAPICHDCLVVNETSKFFYKYIFTARLLEC